MRFELLKTCPLTGARRGRLHLMHGDVETPVFMPVGTQGTVKSQTHESVLESGAQIMLSNTYHLMLRPGAEVIRKSGGLRRFIRWNKPILTDSGGYQVFSLPHARAIDETGARFRSTVDGQKIHLTPETSIGMQLTLGSDIMMAFDHCVPSTCSREEAREAMDRTHRWAQRSLEARGTAPNALFGIVQGACFEDLRLESAATLSAMPFDGMAIGGLAVGETKDEREGMTGVVAKHLPAHKPRYLMGVGTPIDILEAVSRGVDMFDCIIPTAYAQRGVAFTAAGKVQIRRACYKDAQETLDPECSCRTCRTYSLAYLHHLIRSSEFFGWHLLALHNLHFYHGLMQTLRTAIETGTFAQVAERLRQSLPADDPRYPANLRNMEEGPIFAGKKQNPDNVFSSPKHAHTTLAARGNFEAIRSPKGHASLRAKDSGETMHSVSEPMEEATRLYIDGTGLRDRLATDSESEIVVWDLGLGGAANAMALVQAHESAGGRATVTLHSFETDLESLKLAASLPDLFPYLDHEAPRALLMQGEWASPSGRFRWKLHEGDFRQTLSRATESPDFIFFDMFSQKSAPELWTLDVFEQLFARARTKAARLATYSNSTAVRSTLMAAGFYVGLGVRVGPKEATTLAFSQREDALLNRSGLLGAEWVTRWERSQARYPVALAYGHRQAFDQKILTHPQFRL